MQGRAHAPSREPARRRRRRVIDQPALRRSLGDLDRAADFDAAQQALEAIARAIAMPRLSWAPDVSRPGFDAHMDAFMRRQGWPDEVMSLWWNRNVMLKSPLYIRCRFKAMPFVTAVPGETLDLVPEAQKIGAIMVGMGLRALITVPIHLPRGQVAMITWAGPLSPQEANGVLAAAKTELIAAGHYFMQAFGAHVSTGGVSEEELSRLTPREWECLRLTAQGYREAEAAALMGLSPTTVRFHLDNVVRKLGASTRTHAVALAAQLGMLGPIGG